MDAIDQIIKNIINDPDFFIDCGKLQLLEFDGVYPAFENKQDQNQAMEYMEEDIRNLVDKCLPYKLPSDYRYFLERYGGLGYGGDTPYHFAINGTGPKSETEYGYIFSDDVILNPGQLGLLSLGYFRNTRSSLENKDFYIDLVGEKQKGCILSLKHDLLDPYSFVNQEINLDEKKTYFKHLVWESESFLVFLERVAKCRFK